MRLFSPYVGSASSADSLDKANSNQTNGNHLSTDNTDLESGNSFNNRLTHHSNGLLVNDKLTTSNQNQAFDSPPDANGNGYLEDILASPDADSANSPRRRQRRKR